MSKYSASLFTNGRNKAVRIPKELEFDGVNQVTIYRDGDRLIIEPARKSWDSFFELASDSKADDDFLSEREDVVDGKGVKF